MKISILTLFPEMFHGPFEHSIVRRAKEKGLVTISFINIRDFGIGAHKSVDDSAYGGGHGMVLRVDVLEKAIQKARVKKHSKKEEKVVLLSARGERFNQKKADGFSTLSHLILVCGHYEGVDQRVTHFIDEEVSIGDFVTTGGEIPAMLITDAVTRLVKSVLKDGVTENESFRNILEYPQYTKPQVYKKLKVPSVLLLGDHKKIAEWRKKEAEKHTKLQRPDLLAKDY